MLTIRRILNSGIAALCVLTLAGGRPSPAVAQVRPIAVGEEFLGIRLDKDRFSDVMRRYGSPHEIQAGGPRLTESMIPVAPPAGSAPGMPSPGGGLPGFPGGGPPGSPGGGGFGGGPRGSSGSSGSRSSGSPNDEKILYTEQTETTWWYHFARKGKPTYHYAFMFNKAGRVIQIQEYGFSQGGKTKAGVGLGSSLGDVLGKYGFSNDGERAENDKLTLRYGGTNRMAFQIINNQVLGITLARVR